MPPVLDEKPKRVLRLLAWRAKRQGKLRGFAIIELPIGLRIPDVPVFEDAQTQTIWAGLPSKPRNRDGRQLHNEWGRPVWVPVMTWGDKELGDSWAVRIGELVWAKHPGDFDRPQADAGA